MKPFFYSDNQLSVGSNPKFLGMCDNELMKLIKIGPGDFFNFLAFRKNYKSGHATYSVSRGQLVILVDINLVLENQNLSANENYTDF